MNSEERDIISRFVQRVSGTPSGGSVPATGAQPLPPMDPEADQHLSSLFQQNPEARYRITQFAFASEHALEAAGLRIRQLEQQLQAQQQGSQMQPGPGQQAGGQPSGFFSRLFGGPPGSQGQSQGAPYAQPYQGQPGFGGPQQQQGYPQQGYPQQQNYSTPMGAMRGGGPGFLGSALTTAAGVAGGMMAANALEGLFSGHGGGVFGGAGGMDSVNNTTIIEEAPQGADQNWAGDQGSWDQGSGAADQGTWSSPAPDQPDTPADDSGSWDDGGGGGNNDWV